MARFFVHSCSYKKEYHIFDEKKVRQVKAYLVRPLSQTRSGVGDTSRSKTFGGITTIRTLTRNGERTKRRSGLLSVGRRTADMRRRMQSHRA